MGAAPGPEGRGRALSRATIGRATEPRLAGSRRSRHIRVTVARPTPTIPQSSRSKLATMVTSAIPHAQEPRALNQSSSLVRPARRSSVPACRLPTPSHAAAVKDGPVSGPPAGLVLDGCEHDRSLAFGGFSQNTLSTDLFCKPRKFSLLFGGRPPGDARSLLRGGGLPKSAAVWLQAGGLGRRGGDSNRGWQVQAGPMNST